MRSVSTRVRMALIFAHPGWLTAVTLAGAVLAIEHSLANRISPTELRTSMLIGLAIGMPTVLLTKLMVRRHMDFYCEYCLHVGDWASRAEFWRQNWKNLSANIPISLAILATYLAARQLRLHWLPMLGMMLILCLMLYPEQQEVYTRIRAKVTEKANNDSGV